MGLRGRVLGGRYELQSLVAVGGMGQVWRALDARLQRLVAVKVLGGGVTGDPTFRTRFRAEAQHAAVLNHPNIAAVHDYGEDADGDGGPVAWLVMELVDGEPLSALIARSGRLDVRQTLDIAGQTAAALAAAHAAGVVHRDVKPANLLVRRDGVVKITDFGIAWSASSAPITRTGQVVGTANYVSPEQVEGAKATPASDVYALGLVMHECLTGVRAFDGESAVQIALKHVRDAPPPLPPDVPEPVRALVARATAKDPALRLPDGAALLDAVDAVLAAGSAPVRETAPIGAGTVPPLPAAPVRDDAAGATPTAVLPAGFGAETSAGHGRHRPGAVGTAAGEDRAGRGRRRGLIAVVAAVLTVALVVVGALAVAASSGGGRPSAGGASGTASGNQSGGGATSSSPAPTTSSAPAPTTAPAPAPAAPSTTGFTLVSAQWVGHPVERVRGQLAALGLQVRLAPVTTGSVPEGQVTAVDPKEQLTRGSTVTVSYAVAPAQTQAPAGNGRPGRAGEDRKHGGRGD
jgi:serine/threonine-protein kinase